MYGDFDLLLGVLFSRKTKLPGLSETQDYV